MALKEAAVRLAWYIKSYGAIPAADMVKLYLYASGLRHDAEAIELLDEAESIKEYLIEMHRDQK
jgi:hypothetical protein